MDNSWRMRMGIPTARPTPLNPTTLHKIPKHSSRRFVEGGSFHRREDFPGDILDDHLSPEDFTDVFGGPPRSVLCGKFGNGVPASSSSSFFYDEIFRSQENISPSTERIGRSLKEFRIPTKRIHGFYSDIFGCEDDRTWVMRSRSRSKTSSSSVLSSEDLSPPRTAATAVDDDVSLFASKLRPININSRLNPPRKGWDDDHRNQQDMPASVASRPIFCIEKDGFENFRSCSFGLSRKNASPETISIDPISNGSFRVSADDLELKSPSSVVSSVCRSDRDRKTDDILMKEYAIEQEEEDEVMSSYVIEINSNERERTVNESNGVDEAIAWAKEKFQTHSSDQKCETEKLTEETLSRNQLSEGNTDSFRSMEGKQDHKWAAEEEIKPFESKIEMQEMDEKIRLWSKGKESDIRLLLSSLHHILWPNSGWYMVPLRNMIESSQVKKAYQKARLCLHPDKLQQRGATFPQKYIAEKAFSILQDAWAAFISQDIFRR